MSDPEINIVGLSNNKSKSGISLKVLGAIIGVLVLAAGVYAGIILVRQQQNIREKASELMCSDPQAEQCPGTDGILRNCHPPEAGGGPTESACTEAGRAEFCGTRCFICPEANGIWTVTDMSKCQTASSPTATATATSIATNTPTPTATSTTTSGSCLPRVYYEVSRGCNPTAEMFDSNGNGCYSNVGRTCTGIYGTCYVNTAACQAAHPSPTATAKVTPTPTSQSGRCDGSFTMYPSNSEVVGTKITVNATGTCPNGVKNIEVKVEAVSKGFINSSSGSLTFETAGMRAGSYTVGITINDNINSSMLHSTQTNLDLLSTPKPTSTTSPTKTATAVAQGTSTAAPVPVTGVSLPTMLGTGFGIIMILVSLALAL